MVTHVIGTLDMTPELQTKIAAALAMAVAILLWLGLRPWSIALAVAGAILGWIYAVYVVSLTASVTLVLIVSRLLFAWGHRNAPPDDDKGRRETPSRYDPDVIDVEFRRLENKHE